MKLTWTAEIKRINEVAGQPTMPSHIILGQYIRGSACGGHRLEQVINTDGGISVISHDDYGTKRKLYDLLRCFVPIASERK